MELGCKYFFHHFRGGIHFKILQIPPPWISNGCPKVTFRKTNCYLLIQACSQVWIWGAGCFLGESGLFSVLFFQIVDFFRVFFWGKGDFFVHFLGESGLFLAKHVHIPHTPSPGYGPADYSKNNKDYKVLFCSVSNIY